MNKKLLISLVIAVVLLLIGVNFEYIYNYFVWDVPLSKINNSQIVYVEKEDGNYNNMLMPTMKNVTYVNDDSVEIIFAKTKFTDFIPNNFEFTKTVHKEDAFISMCRNVANGTAVYAVILQLTTVNSTFVSFNHYEVYLPKEMECKYPDIIKQSFDVPWILNTQNK